MTLVRSSAAKATIPQESLAAAAGACCAHTIYPITSEPDTIADFQKSLKLGYININFLLHLYRSADLEEPFSLVVLVGGCACRRCRQYGDVIDHGRSRGRSSSNRRHNLIGPVEKMGAEVSISDSLPITFATEFGGNTEDET